MLASAGTIIDENTTQENPATNSTTATESICPKGWTLPSKPQVQAIGNNTSTYVSAFSPVLGGYYNNGNLSSEATYGLWWGSEASNTVRRVNLNYNNGAISTGRNLRYNGTYIRCVSEEKTVLDLTYMQDMTPSSHFSRCRSLYIVN